MQIVIDTEIIKDLIEHEWGYEGIRDDLDEIFEKHGTPLPKGHRKLVAEPTEEDIAKTIGGQNDFAECIREAVKAVFDNAPAIIEADKEDGADGKVADNG